MEISTHLKVVIPLVKASDHDGVLSELYASLELAAGADRAKVICDFKGHENSNAALSRAQTAIFHCLSEEITEPLIAVAVSKKGVPEPKGGGRLHVFFVLLSPIRDSGTHLQLLSRLEGIALDRAFHHAILRTGDEAGIRKEIEKAEGASRTLYMPLSREEVFSELETTEKGLTEEEARRRLKTAGPNTLKKAVNISLIKDFFSNLFFNLFAVLLWAGGFMAFAADMAELGWAIFSVIIINAAFSFWQEYKAERAVEAIKRLLPRKVRVVRDGEVKEIDASVLVPGDLINLSEGDSIPADGRLVGAQDMRVDNSALTGESKPVYKLAEPLPSERGFIWTEVPNLVFAGTSVLSGAGSAIVTATGMDTEIGRVASMTEAIRPEKSPLQKEIVRITKTISLIAVFLGVVFFFLGYRMAGLTFAESFLFAIGIIVANVPEGLLPTVSLSLAMAVQKMAERKAIVKKLSAVETLGSATVICTDKTGTLTANQMCVAKLFVDGLLIEVTGSGYEPAGEFVLNGKPVAGEDLLALGATGLLTASALCNNASLRPPSNERGYWTITGDPTEGALVAAAAKAGLRLDDLAVRFPRTAQLPFDRIRKRMTTIHSVKDAGALGLRGADRGTGAIAVTKGAPRETLELCSRAYLGGKDVEMTEGYRNKVLEENDRMASMGLRILAVAARGVEAKRSYLNDEVETSLTFIGLVAMLDPPRPEVKKAVGDCREAGIKIVMVTGDYGLTALSVAAQIGLGLNPRLITGEELSAMGHGVLQGVLKEGGAIFARVAPKDKLRVVTALQDNGEIVAVTGDGVNDAPALKKADIGVAMGLRGSDVAKESAEIVLADDNFATIVEAIREGRAVFANIKKFITYIFASNIPEIVPFIAFVLFRIPLPLTVMQILAVDLGTDVFPALGLGMEPPEAGVMKQPPRPKHSRLLDFKTLVRAYLFLGPIEAALCLGAFFFAYRLSGWSPGETMSGSGAVYAVATTMTFAGIVATQIGNVFACRTGKDSVFTAGIFKNRFVLYGIAAEAVIMLLLIYVPPLARVFGFAPPGWKGWGLLLIFPVVMLASDEARKALLRKKTRPRHD
ncbi:MAG: HAD-IC family P-type ATPase [Deltaproteobacteria bacterium]|nr:HAD-IC family P-type ATPase [Deltaproteobacteria bacterium]